MTTINQKLKKAIFNVRLQEVYNLIQEGAELGAMPQEVLDSLLKNASGAVGMNKDSTLRYHLVVMAHKAGAEINQRNTERNISPLLWSINSDNKDIFHYLLDNGADILYRDHLDETAIVYALIQEKYYYIPFLLGDKESLNHPKSLDALSLNFFAHTRSIPFDEPFDEAFEILKYCVEHGTDLNALDSNETPLFLAILKRFDYYSESAPEGKLEELLVYFKDKNVDFFKKDKKGWSDLHPKNHTINKFGFR